MLSEDFDYKGECIKRLTFIQEHIEDVIERFAPPVPGLRRGLYPIRRRLERILVKLKE